MDLVLLSAMWIGYFALHSFLLTSSVKTTILSVLRTPEKRYRILYNLISILLLIPIALYYRSLPKPSLMEVPSEMLYWLGIVLMGGGVYLGFKCFSGYNVGEFIGLEEPSLTKELQTEGLNELVRHPLYFSLLVVLFGGLLYAPSYPYLVSAFWIVLYIIIGIQLEEARLVAKFGKAYRKYQDEVPMIIPFYKFK